MTRKVFLGGEGRNELGSWDGHPAYQKSGEPGIVEALLLRVQPQGWTVAGAMKWSTIRKFRVGEHGRAEERNVKALCLHAKERGCDVVAFVRDADGDSDRVQMILETIRNEEAIHAGLGIAGGVAVNVMEAWVLAMQGHAKSEDLGRTAAQTKLESQGVPSKDTVAMVRVVENFDLANLPEDAESLRKWMQKASDALSQR
jgi:hypothetical protein